MSTRNCCCRSVSSNKILLLMIQNVLDVYRFEKDIDVVVLDNMHLRDVVLFLVCGRSSQSRKTATSRKQPTFSDSQKPVNADALAMRRVFQNLLDNCLKFHSRRRQNSSQRMLRASGSMCVEIEDNGPGMSTEELSKIF